MVRPVAAHPNLTPYAANPKFTFDPVNLAFPGTKITLLQLLVDLLCSGFQPTFV
jgi:hypothetical protein